MPIHATIDTDRRLVTAVATGDLVDSDFFGYQRDVWTRPEVADFDEIVDMTGVTSIVELKAEKMRALASLSAKADPPATSARLAIVAPDQLMNALGRVYESMRRDVSPLGKKVMTFGTMEQALNWLGWKGRERKKSG